MRSAVRGALMRAPSLLPSLFPAGRVFWFETGVEGEELILMWHSISPNKKHTAPCTQQNTWRTVHANAVPEWRFGAPSHCPLTPLTHCTLLPPLLPAANYTHLHAYIYTVYVCICAQKDAHHTAHTCRKRGPLGRQRAGQQTPCHASVRHVCVGCMCGVYVWGVCVGCKCGVYVWGVCVGCMCGVYVGCMCAQVSLLSVPSTCVCEFSVHTSNGHVSRVEPRLGKPCRAYVHDIVCDVCVHAWYALLGRRCVCGRYTYTTYTLSP